MDRYPGLWPWVMEEFTPAELADLFEHGSKARG
jgi:hypothetical protein